jgi:protein involved in polysaccharide export with SLBB domain
MAGAQQRPTNDSGGSIQHGPVCVRGNVAKPAIVSFEGEIKLLQVVRAAGGAVPSLKSNGARVYRRHLGTDTGTEIVIESLRQLERGKYQDLTLLPYDVVEVISIKGKKKISANGINPCMSWLPSVGLL